jgi:hypothetical protein
MRPIVKQLAVEQATDREIDAALALEGLAPMTPVEMHEVVEARLAGRAALRLSVGDIVEDTPEITKARQLLSAVLEQIEEKLDTDHYTHVELIRLGKFLSSVSILPRAAALQGRLALAHQYAGFTRSGYDESLRKEAEDAEMLAAAEREEARRAEIDSAH